MTMYAVRTRKPGETSDGIVMARGETRVDTWTCYDDDGDPVDVTAYDFWFTVRRTLGEAVLQKTLIGATSAGIARLDQTTNKGQLTTTIVHADTLESAFPWGCAFCSDLWSRSSSSAYQQLKSPEPFVVESAPTTFAT